MATTNYEFYVKKILYYIIMNKQLMFLSSLLMIISGYILFIKKKHIEENL